MIDLYITGSIVVFIASMIHLTIEFNDYLLLNILHSLSISMLSWIGLLIVIIIRYTTIIVK